MPRTVRSLLFRLGAAAALLTCWFALASPLGAQGTVNWDAPYCGSQPRISSVFDHELPDYNKTFGRLLLYSGFDLLVSANCPGGGMGYQGHSGFDYTRRSAAQGCGKGYVAGVPQDLVYAVDDGSVHYSRWFSPVYHEHDDEMKAGYGLRVDVHHAEDNLSSLYGHLAVAFVDEGVQVQEGQLIGALGDTGYSTGPHLHLGAAHGGEGHRSPFDVYGWNKVYRKGYEYPGFPDPNGGDGYSIRTIYPTESGPQCPVRCGRFDVDNSDPWVVFKCAAGNGTSCPYSEIAPGGYRGNYERMHPRPYPKDYVAQYRCKYQERPGVYVDCEPGVYLVSANVPNAVDRGTGTHIARYEIEYQVAVMDQHQELGVWHPIGVYNFLGTPMVEINDRGDRYDYTAPSGKWVNADSIRFERLCDGYPNHIPAVSASWGSH